MDANDSLGNRSPGLFVSGRFVTSWLRQQSTPYSWLDDWVDVARLDLEPSFAAQISAAYSMAPQLDGIDERLNVFPPAAVDPKYYSNTAVKDDHNAFLYFTCYI